MTDPSKLRALRLLARLRGAACDAAQRSLAQAVATEADAQLAASAAATALAAEDTIDAALDATPIVGAYARWIPSGLEAQRRAAEALARAAAETRAGRQAVINAKIAADAIDGRLRALTAHVETVLVRGEQADLDEAGLRCGHASHATVITLG